MKRTVLDTCSLELAPGWADITATFAEEDAPWSFARPGGAGTLQLSGAVYRGGVRPQASTLDLEAMLRNFGETQELGEARDVARGEEPHAAVGGSFVTPDGFLRVWYVADGESFVLATYVCEAKDAVPTELAACEAMVASIRFDVDEDGDDAAE